MARLCTPPVRAFGAPPGCPALSRGGLHARPRVPQRSEPGAISPRSNRGLRAVQTGTLGLQTSDGVLDGAGSAMFWVVLVVSHPWGICVVCFRACVKPLLWLAKSAGLCPARNRKRSATLLQTFFIRAVACIIFPLTHAAVGAYPRLVALSSINASHGSVPVLAPLPA